ncbi:MAG: hypothetical protein PHP53_01110 [Prolixibacteraceae bacterium]|nr:hypothetical protein [Prolixibacteraceae bacterium]
MTDIRTLYFDFLEIPFPDNLSGEENNGIDLVLLDSDSAGLIDKFIHHDSQLDINDFNLLRQCCRELEIVEKELQGQQKEYFMTLLNIARQTNQYLTNKMKK